jgi:hypothetical protein
MMLTALVLALAVPTAALADPAASPAATPTEITAPAPKLVTGAVAHVAASDASYAQREAQASDLEKFEGGHYYYHERDRGAIILGAVAAIVCGLLVIALVA